MANNNSTTTPRENPSIAYLNGYKQFAEGTKDEPIRMVLKEMRIFHYKNFNPLRFPAEEKPNSYVFDLNEQLIALVGPNGSGKTTVLNALELFCNSIRNGSGCCLPISDLKLYDFNDEMLPISLQGVFTVYYSKAAETKSLTLNVKLVKMTKPCNCKNMGNSATGTHADHQLENDRNAYFCISVEAPVSESVSPHWYTKRCCQSETDRFNLLTTDYGIFAGLFPQAVCFYTKDTMNTNLKKLIQQFSQLEEKTQVTKETQLEKKREEINEELYKIFPLLRLTWGISRPRVVDSGDVQGARAPAGILSLPPRILNNLVGYLRNIKQEFFTSIISRTGEPCLQRSEDEWGSKEHKQFFDITHCSEGEQQYFLLISTMCCAKPHSIILIDEPDAHIFPNAQRSLIDFFYRKMKKLHESNLFCQMVITTHSADIMQAVKLEHIRQIFLNSKTGKPIAIKSLATTGQLFNAMIDVRSSILSHGQLVCLGVHRKILFLESHDDHNFLHGIINRAKPDLLNLPFTTIAKGGRPTPSQIQELIKQLRQFLPEEATLHIFVLVDADLRSDDILQDEKTEYDNIQNNKKLNVQIYYHCWAAREWENWLLSNDILLYEMLFGNKFSNKPYIKELRVQIEQNWSTKLDSLASDSSQQSQPTVATDVTATNVQQLLKDENQFYNWYKEKLDDHFKRLVNNLTSSNMQGCKEIHNEESRKLAREAAEEILYKIGITDDMIAKLDTVHTSGHHLRNPILESIGSTIQKCTGGKCEKEKFKKKESKNSEEGSRNKWLLDRKMQQSIDTKDRNTRKEVTKWIDAKLFFHQLTHGEDNETKNRDLDKYWINAFSMKISGKCTFYGRYFNSLDPKNPDEWPEDFNILLETFRKFVEAS